MNEQTHSIPDQVWVRDEIESPCIKICLVHPSEKICTGCYRTIDEISVWSKLPPEERRRLIQELPKRASRLKMRRGGRKSRR